MKVSLDKEVPPNSEVKFKVKLTLDDYIEFSGAELGFRAPAALKSLDTLQFRIRHQATTKSIENNSRTFNFTRVEKVTDVDGRINIYLPRPQTGLGEIKVGRRIIFDTPSGSFVSELDTEEGVVLRIRRNVTVGGTEHYKLSVSVPLSVWTALPNSVQTGLSNHIFGFKNQTTVVRKKRYRFILDADIRNELIFKDNVHDIMVFGYKQFDDGEQASDVPRYYMIDNDTKELLDLDSPPPKSFADEHFVNEAGQQKNNVPRTFDLNEGRNFIFFCTAVRYIQDKETKEWSADWIQKNSRGRPVFAVNRTLESEA